MSTYLEVPGLGDGSIYIETHISPECTNANLFLKASSDGKVLKASETFLNKSFSQIRAFVSKIAEEVKQVDACPDRLEAKFSVAFSADAGVIISTVGAEANIELKIIWDMH